jgi:hypothetical protein
MSASAWTLLCLPSSFEGLGHGARSDALVAFSAASTPTGRAHGNGVCALQVTRRVQALAKIVCAQQKVADDECELLSAHGISSAVADLGDQLSGLQRGTTHRLLTLLMSLRKDALSLATTEAAREAQRSCLLLSLSFAERQVAPTQILASGMNATDSLHAAVLSTFVKHRLSKSDARAADTAAQLDIRNCTLALVQANDRKRRNAVAAGVTQAVDSAADAAFQKASEAIDVVRAAEANKRNAWFVEQAELASQAAMEVLARALPVAIRSSAAFPSLPRRFLHRAMWLRRGYHELFCATTDK